jgi:Asp-tRNA(Asn)/Glu-tRNA(Gln) amidotransferase C subunit
MNLQKEKELENKNDKKEKVLTPYENFLNIMDQIISGDTGDLNHVIMKYLRLRDDIKKSELENKHFFLDNIDNSASAIITDIQCKMSANNKANIEPEIEQFNKLEEFRAKLTGEGSEIYEGE